jgi:diguanylate cyclase (GGDEF)-like protein
VWIFYVFPLFLLAPIIKRYKLYLICLISIIFIYLGYLLSPVPPWFNRPIDVINRLFGSSAIFIFTFVLIQRQKAEHNLINVNLDLEKRVQQRTGELVLLTTSLEEERARLETILMSIPAAVIIAEAPSGKIIYANQQVENIWQQPFNQADASRFYTEYKVFYPDGRAYRQEDWPITRSLRKGEVVSGVEIHVERSNGTRRILSVSSAPIRSGKNRILAGVSIFSDITERKKMEEEIRHLAHHDELTGLPNRRLFIEMIQFEIAQAKRKHQKMAILFLDLDRFKEVNDTLGHEAGDMLLKQVAKRLKLNLRETDALARIGGDEFNIILSDFNRIEDISVVVDKIMSSFQQPYILNSHELNVTTSIGISIYPDDSNEQDTLFRYADIALYQAKALERNTYHFYNPTINLRSIERLKIETYLRHTLERGELLVYYQPQIDLKTHKMIYAEALVRWQHPEQGLLDPQHFLPTAEDTGFMPTIDEWVIVTACSQFKAWQEAGFNPPGVTVNLSNKEFQNPQLSKTIARLLGESGLPPHCLEIEIAENLAMQNIAYSEQCFHSLIELGVHISLDNFGIGYSSLHLLKKLPINRLKVDQTFIRDLATNPDDQAIMKAVTAMAHNLHLTVVAEGVETAEQLDFLYESDCDQAQGNLFNSPLPTNKFKELLVPAQH